MFILSGKGPAMPGFGQVFGDAGDAGSSPGASWHFGKSLTASRLRFHFPNIFLKTGFRAGPRAWKEKKKKKKNEVVLSSNLVPLPPGLRETQAGPEILLLAFYALSAPNSVRQIRAGAGWTRRSSRQNHSGNVEQAIRGQHRGLSPETGVQRWAPPALPTTDQVFHWRELGCPKNAAKITFCFSVKDDF